jgi:hypothetical protein
MPLLALVSFGRDHSLRASDAVIARRELAEIGVVALLGIGDLLYLWVLAQQIA